jgi:hypothetical protein
MHGLVWSKRRDSISLGADANLPYGLPEACTRARPRSDSSALQEADQERAVDLELAVVIDEAERSEFVQKEIAPRAFSADLRDHADRLGLLARTSSMRMLRASMCAMNTSDIEGCSCSSRIITSQRMNKITLGMLAVAVPVRNPGPPGTPRQRSLPGRARPLCPPSTAPTA